MVCIKKDRPGNPGLVNGRLPGMPDRVKESVEEEDRIAWIYLIAGTLVAAAVFGLGIYARPLETSRVNMAFYLAVIGCSSVIAGCVWPLTLVGGAVCGVLYGLTYLVM